MPNDARTVDDAFIAELKEIVGDRLSTSPAVREQHGRDESYRTPVPPDAVVFAETTDEVSAVVKACARRSVPVIPFGAGTSLEGHVAALRGGVSIDLTRMNQVVALNNEDMDVVVQAGVTRRQLNEYLRDTGLFFPVDPGADATFGGMVATRASGTNAVRYGTMRENTLALTVVLADGRIIRTARRARKSAAGYDLTRLFVGSEGTLGVITEIALRLYGVPEAMAAAVCHFPSVEAAVNTVIQTIQTGIPMARMELLDAVQMDAVNRYSKLDYPLKPTLFMEFHGSTASVEEQAETVKAIAAEEGGEEFEWATRREDRDRLWRARHDVYYATLALRPGSKAMVGDVCVPISRLAECITETEKEMRASPLICCIVGHVGDGNFHTEYLIDPEVPGELAEAKRLTERAVERALAMDGTCTGEHGVGIGKMRFLEPELGEAVDVMAAIKKALDPDNIMNPGKIVEV